MEVSECEVMRVVKQVSLPDAARGILTHCEPELKTHRLSKLARDMELFNIPYIDGVILATWKRLSSSLFRKLAAAHSFVLLPC